MLQRNVGGVVAFVVGAAVSDSGSVPGANAAFAFASAVAAAFAAYFCFCSTKMICRKAVVSRSPGRRSMHIDRQASEWEGENLSIDPRWLRIHCICISIDTF